VSTKPREDPWQGPPLSADSLCATKPALQAAMNERALGAWVVGVMVVTAALGYGTAEEPRTLHVLHSLSMGVVVSAGFYLLVVWVPAHYRRRRIHRNVQQHYVAFKSSCITTFLIASHSQEYRPREMLLDQDEFRRYFKIEVSSGQTRWDAVMNSMNGNKYLLREIQQELAILRDEILYVLNSIDVHDDRVFTFLNRLSHAIYPLKDIEPEYDDIKHIAGFLWEMFSGWSFVEGYRKTDIVQAMIDRI